LGLPVRTVQHSWRADSHERCHLDAIGVQRLDLLQTLVIRTMREL
jgi:hypothetical protein